MFMSVATPSEVNPSNNDAADLQDLLSDYEWELMQSESLDTSIDNASIYRTADNTADIVHCYCVPISSWLLSLAVCYVLYSAVSLEIDIIRYNGEELLSFPLTFPLTAFAAPAAVPSNCILHLFWHLTILSEAHKPKHGHILLSQQEKKKPSVLF